jgi:hypothetical protein
MAHADGGTHGLHSFASMSASRVPPASVSRRARPGVPQLHTRALPVVVAALLLSPMNGCGLGAADDSAPACVLSCDGAVAWNCERNPQNTSNVLVARDCGAGACHTDTYGAFCALSVDPDPVCNGSSRPVCVGAVSTECHSGYVISTYDCSRRVASGFPLNRRSADSPGPFCQSADVNARCWDTPQ